MRPSGQNLVFSQPHFCDRRTEVLREIPELVLQVGDDLGRYGQYPGDPRMQPTNLDVWAVYNNICRAG